MSCVSTTLKCPRCGATFEISLQMDDMISAQAAQAAAGVRLARKIAQAAHDKQCEGRVGAHGSPAVPK